jgi:hypothetical protein
MSPKAQSIIDIIDVLPEKELGLLFELANYLLPDDIESADDRIAFEEARAEYARGEAISEDDI